MLQEEGLDDLCGDMSLLVGDVLVRLPDLAGLDSISELQAVDGPEADATAPRWGVFWSPALRGAPPLPAAVRAALPEEGGFVVRPLTPAGEGFADGGATPSAERPKWLRPDASRRLLAPPRSLHSKMGFPEPALVSNEVFAEVRYGMAPSVVQWLDFEDIRDGTLRIFAIPGFEGDVRLLTVVDEAAAAVVLAQVAAAGKSGASVQRKRLLQFLHAAAAAPAAARWPTTADLTQEDPSEGVASPTRLRAASRPGLRGLFPHQEATIAWMRRVEAFHVDEKGQAETAQVAPLEFAGVTLGSAYEVDLPRGGVVAHPPGSGKTRIVATLIASEQNARPFRPPPRSKAPVEAEEPAGLSSLVICPAHLCQQWREELSVAGVEEDRTTVVDYEATSSLLLRSRRWSRLVIDEPQDCPAGESWHHLQSLSSDLRAAGTALWLLCGTAQAHLETIGRILLGRVGWHVASRQSEWRGCPQLSHLVRSRFVADPPWACLPMPPLEVSSEPVVLRPRESADAAVASLAGFVLDGVLLLSFGAGAAFAAAQERDELLLKMGWHGCVGTALLPAAEHALTDWEGTVAQRSQQKLDELSQEISQLEAEEGLHAARFRLADGDAAIALDLSFLVRETVRVEIQGLLLADGGRGCISEEACTAEWNTDLGHQSFEGSLQWLEPGGEPPKAAGARSFVAFLPCPEDGDFANAVMAAVGVGAGAVIFESDRAVPRPFGYRHDQSPPKVPACMIGRQLGAAARAALGRGGEDLVATVSIVSRTENEAEEEADQGLVTAFIAEDVVDDELHRKLKALREERERCERALRFARQMRALLEKNEANCPVCFHSGEETEAFAVLPDCFHVLCRTCLDRQAGFEPSFACPMCRVSVARLDVVVFRAPGRPTSPKGVEGSEENSVAEAELASGELAEPQQPLTPGPEEQLILAPDTSAPMWEALPSKLQRLIVLLHEILARGPEERILVFTQWAAHVAHLQDVLSDYGLDVLALVGELRETMDALSRFGRPGEPRVLLLSSQRHSSGINLQAARHVIIVHPYCTPTATSQESICRSQMLSFEAQAIGRVRRFPQQRSVHVYRLFAAGTVEEELYAGR